jgi:hypothetical protein
MVLIPWFLVLEIELRHGMNSYGDAARVAASRSKVLGCSISLELFGRLFGTSWCMSEGIFTFAFCVFWAWILALLGTHLLKYKERTASGCQAGLRITGGWGYQSHSGICFVKKLNKHNKSCPERRFGSLHAIGFKYTLNKVLRHAEWAPEDAQGVK